MLPVQRGSGWCDVRGWRAWAGPHNGGLCRWLRCRERLHDVSLMLACSPIYSSVVAFRAFITPSHSWRRRKSGRRRRWRTVQQHNAFLVNNKVNINTNLWERKCVLKRTLMRVICQGRLHTSEVH